MSTLWPLGWTAAAFVAATLGALALRRLLLNAVPRWAPESHALSAAAGALRRPSLWWCVVVGLYVASGIAEDFTLLPSRWHRLLASVIDIALILSVTATLAGLAGGFITKVTEGHVPGGKVTGLAQTVSRVTVGGIGMLVLLSTLGIQVTPILATLGVGGLAVALALQDTLSNLFAGVHLLVDNSLRVGDHIKLGDRAEGFVIDVGWRSTRVRTLANEVVVIPNQIVAREPITNYDLPELRSPFRLMLSIDGSADPDVATKALGDEVERALGQVPGLAAEPAPSISAWPGVADTALDLTVSYYVAAPGDQYRVQHELRKRSLERLRREGIALRAGGRAA